MAAAACTAPVVPPPGGGGGGGGGGTTAPTIGGLSGLPGRQRLEPGRVEPARRARSANYVASINASGTKLHPDFGGDGAYGIPFIVVPGTEPQRAINYTAYGDESDPGPFPIPPTAPVEGGSDPNGDRHVVVVQRDVSPLRARSCVLEAATTGTPTVGVNWDLRSNALRPFEWTSADAAGLPILPGSCATTRSRRAHQPRAALHGVAHATRVHPPRDALRVVEHRPEPAADGPAPAAAGRLRHLALHGQSRVILEALKKYGMIVADNGSTWFITGAADPRWNDDDLNQLKTVPGSAFEAVDTGPVHS